MLLAVEESIPENYSPLSTLFTVVILSCSGVTLLAHFCFALPSIGYVIG